MFYHPINRWRRQKNRWSLRGFVSKSTFCISVLKYWMVTLFDFTNDLKWWYFREMCLVHGENLWAWAILMQDWLSSQTVKMNSGAPSKMRKVVLISSKISLAESLPARLDTEQCTIIQMCWGQFWFEDLTQSELDNQHILWYSQSETAHSLRYYSHPESTLQRSWHQLRF